MINIVKHARWHSAVLFIVTLVLVLYGSLYILLIRPYTKTVSIFHTPAIRNYDKISPGYTLIAPYNNVLNADPNNRGTVYLLDLFGRPVHTWSTVRQPLSAQLTRDGHLVVAMESKSYSKQYPGGGNTGTIQELDWDGNVLWNYDDDAMHHDFILLPNGNVTYVRWELTPPAIARTVRGGIPGTEMKGEIWSDEIVEIDKNGKKVWSWHSYEYLHPAEYIPFSARPRRGWYTNVIDPALPRAGWTYVNGMTYVARDPLENGEAYLVSMRSLNTVMLISKRDGVIIWESPKDMLNTQHDPHLLPNGNVIAFDNGFTRLPVPVPLYGSRVIEIDPRTDTITWSFDGGKGVMDKLAFFGPLVGGAQPMPNGNILVTDGPKGHVFEVTKTGEVVWDLVSPYTTKLTGAFPVNFLYKARRYTKDQVRFPASLPEPGNRTLYTVVTKLSALYPR